MARSRRAGEPIPPPDDAFPWPGRAAALAEAAAAPQGRLERDDALSLPGAPLHRLIIGDNLAALRLVRAELAGQVRLIYIDPPYNTGQRFAYADRFPSHAAWVAMMAPRLVLARDLLRPDGAIFISIGHQEVHHLALLMDAIFGPECRRNLIAIRRGVKSVQAQFPTIAALDHGYEFVLFYARTPAARFPKLYLPAGRDDGAGRPSGWNNHWRGTERPTMRYPLFGVTPARGQWRWSATRSAAAQATYERLSADLGAAWPEQARIDAWVADEHRRTGARVDLLRLSRRGRPEHYIPPAPGKLASDLWTDLAPNGPAQLRQIFGDLPLFETPKSVDLIRRLLEFACGPDDLVLDCFAGSCATAHAVILANQRDGGARRCVCVQSPDPLPGGERVVDGVPLRTIAEIGRERIRRALAALEPADAARQGLAVWRVAPP